MLNMYRRDLKTLAHTELQRPYYFLANKCQTFLNYGREPVVIFGNDTNCIIFDINVRQRVTWR